MRETIEKSARHLYGLIHARYIVTTRGLAKMVCLPLFLYWFLSASKHVNSTKSYGSDLRMTH